MADSPERSEIREPIQLATIDASCPKIKDVPRLNFSSYPHGRAMDEAKTQLVCVDERKDTRNAAWSADRLLCSLCPDSAQTTFGKVFSKMSQRDLESKWPSIVAHAVTCVHNQMKNNPDDLVSIRVKESWKRYMINLRYPLQ